MSITARIAAGTIMIYTHLPSNFRCMKYQPTMPALTAARQSSPSKQDAEVVFEDGRIVILDRRQDGQAGKHLQVRGVCLGRVLGGDFGRRHLCRLSH